MKPWISGNCSCFLAAFHSNLHPQQKASQILQNSRIVVIMG